LKSVLLIHGFDLNADASYPHNAGMGIGADGQQCCG
jgi:hypothetical protein